MPLKTVRQNSFTGGEITPGLYSAYDLEKTASGVKEMLNVVPVVHGGAENRGGTQFINQLKYSDKEARLIPFVFSSGQSYVLEFGHNYIRIHSNTEGTLVEKDVVTITGISNTNPVVVTASAAGVADGDWIYITGVEGMPEINNRFYIVYEALGNIFKLMDLFSVDIDATNYGIYTSGGTVDRVYEVDTSVVPAYDEADLKRVSYVQNADVMYLAHIDYRLRTLTRKGVADWELELVEFGPFTEAPQTLEFNGTNDDYKPLFYALVTAVSVDGEESIASNIVGPNGIRGGEGHTRLDWIGPWPVTNVDHYNIYLKQQGYLEFGYFFQVPGNVAGPGYSYEFEVDSEDIVVNYDEVYSATEIYTDFTQPGNYPSTLLFFDQRLILAGTLNEPLTIWGSEIGFYKTFAYHKPIRDTDAYKFMIASPKLDAIRWIDGFKSLVIGTASDEWLLSSGSTTSATITPTSVALRKLSSWGASAIHPLIIGDSMLFIEASGFTVRDMSYTQFYETYAGTDLSILASHLLKGYSILGWCYQQVPDSVIWCIRSDGTLLGMTYHKEHKIYGWHKHVTRGEFRDACTIPREIGFAKQDDVYFIVERFIRGQKVKYLEKLRNRLPVDAQGYRDVKDAFFVDAGLTYDNPIFIESIERASPAVVTTVADHNLATDDFVDIDRILYGDLLNGKRYRVVVLTPVTFELYTETGGLPVDGSALSGDASGGEVRKVVYSVSGLYHLEGETQVAVLADGSAFFVPVLEGAKIQLPDEGASRVHVGLPFYSQLTTLDFDFVTQDGYLQDRKRTLASVVIELENTRSLLIGPSYSNLVEIPFRSTEAYGQPVKLFNGEKEMALPSGDPRASQLAIFNVQPVPFTILSLMPRIKYD